MSNWGQHVYLNRLSCYWNTRELTQSEKSRLYTKSVLNYYGFWVNGLIHLVPIYLFYKKGFFSVKGDFAFWKNIFLVSSVSILSKSQIDWVLNLSLAYEIHFLADKYESPKDEYRKKYQMEKTKLNMTRMMKYEEMRDRGVNMDNLISVSKEL